MSEYIITNEQLNWFLERMDETDVIPSAIVLTHLKPIVRCKDCKHFTPKGTHKFENGKVNADYCDYVRGWMLQTTPDGFCAWVEEDDKDADGDLWCRMNRRHVDGRGFCELGWEK